MSYILLAVAASLALLGGTALRTPRFGSPAWVVAMTASEVAGPLLVLSGALLAGSLAGDWAGGWPGVAAHVMLGVAIVSFTAALGRGFRARGAVESALGGFLGREVRLRRPGPQAVLFPFPVRPRRIRVETGLSYGPHERHVFDHIHADPGERAPVLIHVHGGGWWRGRRDTQARPLLNRLARGGWRVLTPSYRLSPEATFPDHLDDIVLMLSWVRAHAEDLGADASTIAIAGGSTGGHLAALVALGDPSLTACVPLYGVHDMLGDDGEPLWPYLATSVMKSSPLEDPEAWHRASPARMATSDRPPFLVIHGAEDTLVDPALSRRLVAALRREGGPVAELMEVPWANHGFEFFAGPRGRLVADAVLVALDGVREERLTPGDRP